VVMAGALHCSVITKAAVTESRRTSLFGGLVESIGAISERTEAGKWL
jgi:hypothetical protein